MTIKLTSAMALGLAALAASPEDFPSLTKEIALTSWNSTTAATGPTGCSFGPFMLPVVGAKNPLCSVSAAIGTVRYAALNFPNSGKTCVAAVLNQPNEIDIADVANDRPLTLRFPYTRQGGGTGISAGGVCTGECAIITARVFSQVDGSIIALPGYGATYTSDLLPNGGPNAQGKKITGAIRGIAFPVTRRNPLIVELCRDAANAFDTSTATVRLVNPLSVVWPIVRGPLP